MSDWTEEDSSTYRAIADVAVPRRREMMATLLDAIPFSAEDAFRGVEVGTGDGSLAEALLDRFPQATLLGLDGSESMRHVAKERTSRFGARMRMRGFELAALDWWDLMHGAQVVVSSLCLHHLNDAKKQYLFKAIADRLSPNGALLVADLVEPSHPAARRLAGEAWDAAALAQAKGIGVQDRFSQFVDARWNHHRFPDPADHPSPLFHLLVWLRHAGFPAVDCFWMHAGHAVFGGYEGTGVPV